MPSFTSPRFNTASSSSAAQHVAASSKGTFRPFGRTIGQHARLLATLSHPGCPVEAYPLLGTCVFALAYIGVRFYQAKDMLDVSFLASRHEIPWKDQPVSDGRNLTSVYARGDGIETRKFSYPKPKSFFQRKFEPDQYQTSA